MKKIIQEVNVEVSPDEAELVLKIKMMWVADGSPDPLAPSKSDLIDKIAKFLETSLEPSATR